MIKFKEGEKEITLNEKTQDYIRGQIIDVPNHEIWKKEHPSFIDSHHIWNSSLREKYVQCKDELYAFGLPITNIGFKANGTIALSYYHHMQDNMYSLVETTPKSFEELEQMSVEEFKSFLKDEIVKSEELHKTIIESGILNKYYSIESYVPVTDSGGEWISYATFVPAKDMDMLTGGVIKDDMCFVTPDPENPFGTYYSIYTTEEFDQKYTEVTREQLEKYQRKEDCYKEKEHEFDFQEIGDR